MNQEKKLVTLWERPSYDGKGFTYYLLYTDEIGHRRQKSLGHCDNRKAERQRAAFERHLRIGNVEPGSLTLEDFVEDSLQRTGDQIRESTKVEYKQAMGDFVKVIGNIDFKKVQSSHGEYFRQTCLDRGESPATVSKKLKEIKRFFSLAVQRKQLDENPLLYVKSPKVPKKRIKIYTEDEIQLLIEKASEFQNVDILEWDLMITVAITTAMRKSELLNLIWDDVDFEQMTIEVNAKEKTAQTWEWRIKDTDHRTLPLRDDVGKLLKELKLRRPADCPYVFVPPARYDAIQELRRRGKWTLSDARNSLINNFTRQFDRIISLVGIAERTFHDIRRTAITNWFRQGLSEYDVMTLAGHANFETTHKFYLAIADDLVSRARKAVVHRVSQELIEKSCQPHLRIA
jgi:integrase